MKKSLSLMTVGLTVALGLWTSSADAARKTTRLEKGWQLTDSSGTIDVSVPHCWNAIDGADGGSKEGSSANGSGYWRGAKTYTRPLAVKVEPGRRYFLRFEGASITADVKVNGVPVAKHAGAFGAFAADITGALRADDNTLSVTVDNSFSPDIPPVSGDFTVFGGLYRPVTLIETDALCIDPVNTFATPGVSLTQKTLSDAKGELTVAVNVSGAFNPKAQLVFKVLDAKGTTVADKRVPLQSADAVTPNHYLVATDLAVDKPTRWHGRKNPYLYTVLVTLEVDGHPVDEVTQRWGFRTIDITVDKGFVLNGEPMKIRGVNRHQDKEGQGWALSDADHETDIRLMADMGITGWRAAHYPHATKMYDLCDENGIVVWAEVPVVDRINDTQSFFDNAKFQMAEMIAQHRNHPSIFVWGTANEIGNGPEGNKTKADAAVRLMKELIAIAEKCDSTRYAGITANNMKRKENPLHQLIGQNTYPGWYGSNPDAMKGIIAGLCKLFPAHPVAINEYGAGASIKTHEIPAKQPKTISPWHPEEWQTLCHEAHYRAIKNSPPQLWGSFVWNMFDFGADNRKEGDHMGRNDKGLVSYDRKTPKDAYYIYQANWTDKPMVHLTSCRFTERKIDKMPVAAFSNCDEVELFVNEVSVGKAAPNDLCKFEWQDVQFKSGRNTLKAVGKKDGQTVSDSYEFDVVPSSGN